VSLRPRLFRQAAAWTLGTAALVGGPVAAVEYAVPEVEPLAHTPPEQTSYMRLRVLETGTPARAARVQWTELGRISPHLVCAMVKAEDRGFFHHQGFEWEQTRNAFRKLLLRQPTGGGSTITQQTARNLFLAPERSLLRKTREALVARELERRLTKRRILEIYLNVVEWGDGVWGVAAASGHYFGKAPADLDPFEATFLASLTAAPRRQLAGEYRVRAERVQSRVLGQMYRSGLIGDAEWREARARSIVVHDLLAARVPLLDALRRDGWGRASALTPPARFHAEVLPASRTLEEACGFAREMEEERLSRQLAVPAAAGTGLR